VSLTLPLGHATTHSLYHSHSHCTTHTLTIPLTHPTTHSLYHSPTHSLLSRTHIHYSLTDTVATHSLTHSLARTHNLPTHNSLTTLSLLYSHTPYSHTYNVLTTKNLVKSFLYDSLGWKIERIVIQLQFCMLCAVSELL
jgi:hypothetical protein